MSVVFFLVFVCIAGISDLPSLEFLRDRLLSNQQASGCNFDVYFELECLTFGNRNQTPDQLNKLNKLKKLNIKLSPTGNRKFKIYTQYAKDGSFLSEVSGDLAKGAATRYLSKDGGLMRYFGHAQLAKNDFASTSNPDVMIDPRDCASTSGGLSVMEVLSDSRFVVSSLERVDGAKIRIIGSLPTKKKSSYSMGWTIDLSEEVGYMPVFFSCGVLGSDGVLLEKPMLGEFSYRKSTGGFYFPDAWRRTSFAEELKSYEEVGKVTKVVMFGSGYRETSDASLPVGTRLVDGVAKEVSYIEGRKSSAFAAVMLWFFAAVFSFVVLLIVLRRLRR